MKLRQIVARDLGDRLNRALARIGMSGTVHQLGELARRDRAGLILPAADALDGLQLRQLDAFRLKRRGAQQIGKDPQTGLQIFLEDVERGRPRLLPDAE